MCDLPHVLPSVHILYFPSRRFLLLSGSQFPQLFIKRLETVTGLIRTLEGQGLRTPGHPASGYKNPLSP